MRYRKSKIFKNCKHIYKDIFTGDDVIIPLERLTDEVLAIL